MILSTALGLLPFLAPVQSGVPGDLASQRTVGRLLDRDGKPWVGAEVHLFAHQVLGAPDGGWQDRIVVQSGERGRFSVKLIPGLVYSAYAVQDVEDKVRCTAIRSWVLAGHPIELVETRSNRRVSYKLEGQDAWRAQGPLRFEVRLDHRDLYSQKVECVDGSIEMPPLPGEYAVLRILDAKNRFITTRSIDLDPSRPLRPLPLLPPYEVRLLCRRSDADNAPPLVGARVFLFNFRSFESLGKTDDQGRLGIWVQRHGKLDKAPVNRTLLILAPGYSESLIPLFPKHPILNARIGERDEKGMDLLYTARPRKSLRGRLLDRNGKALAGRRLILRSELFPVRKRAELNDWVRLPREHSSDAEGRFEIPLPDELPGSRSALLSLSLIQGVRETLIFTSDIDTLDPGEELQLRLWEFASVTFRFHGQEEGKPLLCHYLPLGKSGWRTIPQALHRIAKGRGRFDFRLPPGRYLFAFESPGRFLQTEITVPSRGKEMSLDLEFPATRRIRGRVEDADGNPVPRAGLRWTPMLKRKSRRFSSYRSPLADELVFNRIHVGAGGLFDFLLPAGPRDYQLSGSWNKPGGSYWRSPRLLTIQEGKADLLDLKIKFKTR